MDFDTTQSSYKELRSILKERTNQVVVFAGAGLSSPSGLPTWKKLRDALIVEAKKKHFCFRRSKG